MSEQEPNKIVSTEPDEESSTLSVIVGAIGDYLGDIPAVIKKNIGKAFGQLMKIPGAWIDGTAAEIKAHSEARVALTKATAKSIAKKIDIDDSIAVIAAETHASKILRQTVNTAKVLQHAASDIKRDPPPADQAISDITDDWLNAFEQEAVNMSSEQMQKLFGKILAGEIRRPTTYSIRTVKLMAQLDNRAAELFRNLCSSALTLQLGPDVQDSRVVAVAGSAASNGLQKYGLSFSDLNILFEYGLIINDYNSYMPYQFAIVEENKIRLPFRYMNSHFGLKPMKEMSQEQKQAFRLNGVALSRAGMELINIVDIEENLNYTAALREHMTAQGFEIVPVMMPNKTR
ncbi:uncharacterized protein DUF2806 [Variovorax sp. 54]|uniref:DUF2806 domain-containing protein n=1 Tax=Variovorax sp. 54 TaxID=2035212 RepID=UPI000C19313E|nr:DUF2806 domain-containing protein [Variovorax sp. 54]PIF74402.1 uncharacterized protein DUF2806 [Variovorax sp. 54]